MAPKSALTPRLSWSTRILQPPYSRMWCPYVAPKRSERPLATTGPVRNRIVFVMRGFGKISIEKSWCHPSSIMAMERPNGAPGAHPRDQYRFPCAHIRVWGTFGCIKAVRRAEGIEGFVVDEIVIAMGDIAHGVSPSSIMAMERPNGAPGAHPGDQYRFPGAHIRV